MAARHQYEELGRQLTAIGAVKRGLARILPPECPMGSAAVLSLLKHHGPMRMSRLAELLDVDISVTSRHVAHVAEHGWIDRSADPVDRRSRILTITDSGRAKVTELSERYVHALAGYLADWSDDEIDQLNTQLARLRDSFDGARPGSPRAPHTPGTAAPETSAHETTPHGITTPPP
ncbi:MarR family winged helix-turn-helix transcriptional regulator [Streptomyces sp. TS71-3]|uniref:MarR family winged helix-turn-helix transcriptional regulator n=1 Tax=Streptomyces sp. TS71-3 TaxID=2733862 RepID=UPI001B2C740C|nr:MarR family transcriptional regulator [Streptomyces sp. TS71-3]GHJ40133.1 MarR family transcriptional regulator [Streptomyces sp. TS71-3]